MLRARRQNSFLQAQSNASVAKRGKRVQLVNEAL
jgi:hypothetical protein